MLGDLDSYVQKNESQSPIYAIHKSKFKVDKILNKSHHTIKILDENIGRKIPDIPCSDSFNCLLGKGHKGKKKTK